MQVKILKITLISVLALVAVAFYSDLRKSRHPNEFDLISRKNVVDFLDRYETSLQSLPFFPKKNRTAILEEFQERSAEEFANLVRTIQEQEAGMRARFSQSFSAEVFDAYILERPGAKRSLYHITSHYNPAFLYAGFMHALADAFPDSNVVLIHNMKSLTTPVVKSAEQGQNLFAQGMTRLENRYDFLKKSEKDLFVVCQGYLIAYKYLTEHQNGFHRAVLFTPKAINRVPAYALPDQIFPPGQKFATYAEISIYYDLQEGRSPISYPYPKELNRLYLSSERAFEALFERGADLSGIKNKYLVYAVHSNLVPLENSMASIFDPDKIGKITVGGHLDSLMYDGEPRKQLIQILKGFGI